MNQKIDLYPHQQTGLEFLAQRNFACLWDLPGLGKTAQAIRAADAVAARKILVICPAAVRSIWEDELRLWQTTARPVTTIDGYLIEPPGDGVTIVSHACLSHMPKGGLPPGQFSWPLILQGAPYDVIILDEQHLGFKDPGAKRANAFFRGLCNNKARHVWCLTGTPFVNSAADLWMLMAFGAKEPYSRNDWESQFTIRKPDKYDPRGFKPTGIRQTEKLAHNLKPYALRRTLDSVGIKLPKLTIDESYFSLPPEKSLPLMQQLSHFSPRQIERMLVFGNEPKEKALAQIRRELGVAKADYAVELINASVRAADGPLVVFFQHTDVRNKLLQLLRPYRLAVIDGKTPPGKIREARSIFDANELDILLVQLDAGGVGLNLTRSHRVIVTELPWTAVTLFQAIKRVHRIGQTAPCQAILIQAQNIWLEDLLAKTVSRKAHAADQLLNLMTVNY
jgi:SWI/SNF-related matrix-associated actin-dependent regulator 1 of chromatin subfamily A